MNVPWRSTRAEVSSALDVGRKSSGRSKLTTSSVIAKAKTPSVRASSRPFEINSSGLAIILPGVPEQFEEIRFPAKNPEQSGAGEDGRTTHRTGPPPGPLSQKKWSSDRWSKNA